MSDKEIEFTVFCIENVAEKLCKSGLEMYSLLKEANLIEDYIVPSYEALHTKSKNYIVDDVVSVMKKKGLVV